MFLGDLKVGVSFVGDLEAWLKISKETDKKRKNWKNRAKQHSRGLHGRVTDYTAV